MNSRWQKTLNIQNFHKNPNIEESFNSLLSEGLTEFGRKERVTIYRTLLLSYYTRTTQESKCIIYYKKWPILLNDLINMKRCENSSNTIPILFKICNRHGIKRLDSVYTLLTRKFPIEMTKDLLQCILKSMIPDLDDMVSLLNSYLSLVDCISLFVPLIHSCAPPKSLERHRRVSSSYDKRLKSIDLTITKLGLKHSIESYTSMLSVYLMLNNFTLAFQVLKRMENDKITPDLQLINIILRYCNTPKSFDLAQKYFRLIYAMNMRPDFDTFKYYLNSCAKMKEMSCSSLFWECKNTVGLDPTIINIMIKYCLKARSYERALSYFNIFTKLNLSPNIFTFKILLSYCNFPNRSHNAEQIYKLMKIHRIHNDCYVIGKVIRSYLLDERTEEAYKILLSTSELYLSQSKRIPNSFSLSFMEMLIAFSQIPNRKSHLRYYALWEIANIYFGQVKGHKKWLRTLKVKPVKRLGDRRDRFSFRAFLYDEPI